MNKKLIALSGLVLGLSPVALFAQGTTGTLNTCEGIGLGDFMGILCKISDLLNAVVPILVALAVIYFIYGVATYVIASEEEAKKAGRNRIIYGIIGLAVIIAAWGLVKLLTDSFGIDTDAQNIVYPTVPY